MSVYRCEVCDYLYDETAEGAAWADLPDDWVCPVCGSEKSYFVEAAPEPVADRGASAGTAEAGAEADAVASAKAAGASDDAPRRQSDTRETLMADIHRMAETGESILEPMRTEPPGFTWDDLLIVGAQLARIPLDADVPVRTETVIGPAAAKPLVLDTPILVSHMSFGALSREVKLALAKGSAAVGAGMCSGEGGILPESIEAAHRYVFEIVPRGYSLTEENLRRADALEIKIGQSAKPGLGGHLPGEKVTDEVAAVRGVEPGKSVTSPAAFPDIRSAEDLAAKIAWLRETSGGRPVGVKLAAGDIEADLAVALEGNPDFVTIDGRPGATGAAPKVVKAATSVPTLFALHRARRFLDEQGATGVSLIVTGGLRVSSDFAKALALGADAVAVATAALIAAGCQQYRVCHTGRCPVGVATQDPELRARLDVEVSARRVENYLRVCTEELRDFARMTGNDDVHGLSPRDLVTTSSEISAHTLVRHV
jgi:glutamate synthase domain-containing protein 2/rubredoxin